MFDQLKEVKYIKEMKCLQLKLEAYLEPKQASMIKLLSENSYRLKALSYFRKKSCIRDSQLGSK